MTLPIFLSLLPIVAGVAVSSMSDASFQLLGLAMAMGTAACSQAAAPCHRATVPPCHVAALLRPPGDDLTPLKHSADSRQGTPCRLRRDT